MARKIILNRTIWKIWAKFWQKKFKLNSTISKTQFFKGVSLAIQNKPSKSELEKNGLKICIYSFFFKFGNRVQNLKMQKLEDDLSVFKILAFCDQNFFGDKINQWAIVGFSREICRQLKLSKF